MVFFENYFHLNQLMPTTSEFRGDFFFARSTILNRLRSITFHLSVLSFQYYLGL